MSDNSSKYSDMKLNPVIKVTSDSVDNRRMKVLISAEAGFLRDSLRTFLQSFRFVTIVGECPIGLNCVAKIRQLHPEVILIDCSPGNSGWAAFLGMLRESHPEIRCLAISDTLSTARQAREYGAAEVLPHGFTSQELYQALQRIDRLQRG